MLVLYGGDDVDFILMCVLNLISTFLLLSLGRYLCW